MSGAPGISGKVEIPDPVKAATQTIDNVAGGVANVNKFFGLLSNGAFVQEVGKRFMVSAAGVGIAVIGFVVLVSASKTGQGVIKTGVKAGAAVATDGASLAAEGVAKGAKGVANAGTN